MTSSPVTDMTGRNPGTNLPDYQQPDDENITPIVFTGTVAGYFRVFTFNTLMTVLTLGAYSPWAKVRNLRYLAGNISVFNGTFDFDARPVVILISRVIVILLLAAATIADDLLVVLPGLGYGTLLLAVLMPLAIVRGRAFMARHTLYKGVKFSYRKEYGQVLILILAPTVLIAALMYNFSWKIDILADLSTTQVALMTLLIAMWPLWPWLLHRSLVSQMSLGKLDMRFATGAGEYLLQLHKISVLVTVMYFALATTSKLILGSANLIFIGSYATITIFFMVLVYSIVMALLAKLFWQSLYFSDGSTVLSRLSVGKYAWIIFTNLLLVVLSLGLLYPWSQIRKWRMLIGSLHIRPDSSMRSIASGQTDAESALGAEFGELTDFEIDAGLI